MKNLFFTIFLILTILFAFTCVSAQEEQFKFVLSYEAAGDIDKANELNEQILDEFPSFIKSHEIRLKWYSDYNYYSEVIDFADEYLSVLDSNAFERLAYANYMKGIAYQELKVEELAFETLDKARIQALKDTSDKTEFLRDIYMALYEYEQVKQVCHKEFSDGTFTASTWFDLTYVYLIQDSVKNSILTSQHWIASDSTNFEAYYMSAKVYQLMGDDETAIKYAIKAVHFSNFQNVKSIDCLIDVGKSIPEYACSLINIAMESDSVITWFSIKAELCGLAGDWSAAYKSYTNYINLASNFTPHWEYGMRAEAAFELGFIDKAIEDYEIYLEKYQRKDYVLMKVGECYRLMGEFEKASTYYTWAITYNPKECFYYYRRGWSKEYLEDYDGALADYNQCVKIDPDYAYAYLHRGRLYEEKMSNKKSAKADYKTILELDDDVLQNGNCKQYAYMHLNRNKEAMLWMDKILEAYPTAGNYYEATCLYALMGKSNDALAFLEKAFELGYRSFEHANNDDDLYSIHELDAYRELVVKWRKTIDIEQGSLVMESK